MDHLTKVITTKSGHSRIKMFNVHIKKQQRKMDSGMIHSFRVICDIKGLLALLEWKSRTFNWKRFARTAEWMCRADNIRFIFEIFFSFIFCTHGMGFFSPASQLVRNCHHNGRYPLNWQSMYDTYAPSRGKSTKRKRWMKMWFHMNAKTNMNIPNWTNEWMNE